MSQTINYDLPAVDRTLPNPRSVESLLAPQRDAGNISHNDYEAAVRFSASRHRFYPLIGSLLALPVTFAFRKPSWSPARTYVILLASTFGGSLAGQAVKFFAHIKFVRSLENPSGFVRALENARKNLITTSDSKWATDTDPIPTDPSPIVSSKLDIQKPSNNPPSKWDQIRAVNARPSTNSSWDALRQSHERSRISPVSSEPDPDAFHRSRSQDRIAEQAEFDEMLARERNIKDRS